MRRHSRIRTLIAAAVVSTLTAALTTMPGLTSGAMATTVPTGSTHLVDACGPVPAGFARCLAVVRTDVHGGKGVRGPAASAATGKAAALPQGYGPADLRSAYRLPSTGGGKQTIALVDAGDDASAEADLAVYRKTYGLPPCTTANGCFRKVNQNGATNPLPQDQGWGVEISLDLDMASAACPHCHLLLVEADTASSADLAASEDTAVTLGANEVSNSYGAVEANGMQTFEAAYSHPGVAILAASGDFGYGIPYFPATFSSVVAVGGTTLKKSASTRGWTETAWVDASSGCSAWIAKPAWQKDKHCPGRMVADVAADADPNTGPAIYGTDSFGGWGVVGGTSASSPFIAGVIALAGNPAAFPDASYLYSHTGKLHDVIGGSNAVSENCGGDYQCTAVKGYDGPTGNGTPNGLGAF